LNAEKKYKVIFAIIAQEIPLTNWSAI